MLFWPILGRFWCPAATLETLSSTLSKFEKNPKNQTNNKIPKIQYKLK